jgi:NAD(P)-dependent dehydrogenase (short-subunit alcohol dehydrogenase family)
VQQVVLITGCSSGIGLASALYLKNTHHIIATTRTTKDAIALRELNLEAYKLDVTNSKEIDEVLGIILDKYKRLDVVFNNAGYGQAGALEDISKEVLKEQFETNVFGLFEVTKKALKIMKKQGYGKIIQHSSVLGLVSLRFRGAYNASKYAIEGLSDTLRLELMDSNIFISTLNTGPVLSNFRDNAKAKLRQNIDINNSYFVNEYKKALSQEKSDVPFTLYPIDVAKIVEKIISTSKPKPRYYITKATYILGFLKKILPTGALDKVLYKI